MDCKYDVNALLEMARECLEAEHDLQVYLLTYEGGWVHNIAPEKYGLSVMYDTEARAAWHALSVACRIVSADYKTVVATAKAMNRFEKRVRWQVCAKIGWKSSAEDNARRFLAVHDTWDSCFHSTGRRWPWAT